MLHPKVPARRRGGGAEVPARVRGGRAGDPLTYHLARSPRCRTVQAERRTREGGAAGSVRGTSFPSPWHYPGRHDDIRHDMQARGRRCRRPEHPIQLIREGEFRATAINILCSCRFAWPAAGGYHCAAVGEDGALFVWGDGARGRLGTGDTAARLVPTRVAGLPAPVRQVAAGNHHSAMVTEGGELLMCGYGGCGWLGLGDEDDRMTPTLVARAVFDGEAVLMVACGESHTATVTEDGGVYTCGLGKDGRLGHGNEEDQLVPRRVPAARFNDEQVVMLAAGGAHSVALSEAGHVFTWGLGWHGQLGHNDRENQRAPRQVDPGRFGDEKVIFVGGGGFHTVAVTARGRLYTWGYGGAGELGHGDTDRRMVPRLVGAGAFGGSAVVMAACGHMHTLVVTHDGALWACGRGLNGELGLNDDGPRHVFERVGTGEFAGAKIVAAAAGYSHSAAVTEDGALWTWGQNVDGQLGLGDRQRRLVPTQVAMAGLGGERIGCCRALPAEHALAFAMGTHGRLGGGGQAGAGAAGGVRRSLRLQEKAASPCYSLKEELVKIIVRMSVRWPAGPAGVDEGMVRLLGGGVGGGARDVGVATTH